ncbi:TPR-like protein [Nemania abortiva]|nr:TPR-like protein [Nemania abortiva]
MSNTISSFGAIESNNALVGNHFFAPTNITIRERLGHPHAQPPAVCRSIPLPPNEDLVHRDDVTRELEQLLPATPDYQAAALWGLGGSGKTQIALAYAYDRYRGDPTCSVFWVNADSETSFTEGYQSIARKLGLATSLEDEDLLRTVRERIEANPNWVLVLDNADDLGLFGVTQAQHTYSSGPRVNLNLFVPHGPTGTILWTSRDRQIAGSLVAAKRAIHITQMTYEEAETLLDTIRDKRTEENEHDAVNELLVELDNLPLAISQAAAYMRRTSASIRDYLSLIRNRKRRWKTLRRSEGDRYRQERISNSVLETWDISVQYLRKENELIYNVLHTLAFVDNQNIPFDLIREAVRLDKEAATPLDQLSDNDTESDSDESGYDDESSDGDEGSDGDESEESEDDDFDDIMEVATRLCEFSFLSIRASNQSSQKKAYDMHKLVQDAARYRLQRGGDGAKGETYFAKAAFRIISGLFPAVASWNKAESFLDPQQKIQGRCEQYLAHAQQAGAWVELYGEEIEVSWLLESVSFYLHTRGRMREAESVIKKAFDFRQRILGKQHPDMLGYMELLAEAYYTTGKYKEAKNMSQQALDLMKELHVATGTRHPAALSTENGLAIDLYHLRRFKEAEEILRRVIEQEEEAQDKSYLTTLKHKHNLAWAIERQGRHKEAEEIHREVLDLLEENYGAEHLKISRAMKGLSCALLNQNKYEEAEKLCRQALDLEGGILGIKHPYTLTSMCSLATALRMQTKFEDAENLFRQTLDIGKEVLGAKHPDMLTIMSGLARAIEGQGKDEEAEKLYQQILDLSKEVLGEKHSETLDYMTDLARVLEAQEKYKEAEKLSRLSTGLSEEILGGKHPKTLWSMNHLAVTLEKQRKYEEAEKLHRQVLDLSKEALGETHPYTLIYMNWLIYVLREQGKHEEAEEIARGRGADNLSASSADEQASASRPSRKARSIQHKTKHRKRVRSRPYKKRGKGQGLAAYRNKLHCFSCSAPAQS